MVILTDFTQKKQFICSQISNYFSNSFIILKAVTDIHKIHKKEAKFF